MAPLAPAHALARAQQYGEWRKSKDSVSDKTVHTICRVRDFNPCIHPCVIHTYRQTDRQTDRQTGRQTDRHASNTCIQYTLVVATCISFLVVIFVVLLLLLLLLVVVVVVFVVIVLPAVWRAPYAVQAAGVVPPFLTHAANRRHL